MSAKTILLATCAAFLTAPVLAQNYSVDWFTIDGGGGVSTGGVYAVTGTIGQPDAGLMTGGSYAVAGGFWAGSPPFKRRARHSSLSSAPTRASSSPGHCRPPGSGSIKAAHSPARRSP